METLLGLLELLVPVLVGILTLVVFDGIKKLTMLKGKLPPWLQQMTVPLVAFGLTWLSAVLGGFVLPETLELFDEPTVSALLSAIAAFAIKAGQKATKAEVAAGVKALSDAGAS